jgi:DNA-binding PadR family transcriptional regulator
MTNLELILLGILKEGPAHAYNIAQLITERGIRAQTAVGFSTIYTTLDKLEQAGYLTSTIEHQPKLPPRRIYRLTEKGDQFFLQEIQRTLSQPVTDISPFEIALSLGKYLGTEQLREALTIYEAELSRLIQIKLKELTDCPPQDQLLRAVYTRPLVIWQTERKWVRELLNLI